MTYVHRLINAKLDQILKFRDTGTRTNLVCGIECANITEGEEIPRWTEKQLGATRGNSLAQK